MKRKLACAAAAAALLLPAAFATPSIAQAQQRQPGHHFFERFDSNDDGSITREEFASAREAHFKEADANSDGFIDDEERAAMRRRFRAMRMERFHARLDQDNDGQISEEEFLSHRRERFREIDADKDGKLSQDELQKAWEQRAERRMERRGERRDERRGWRGHHHRARGDHHGPRWGGHHRHASWHRADLDDDGKISREEFAGMTGRVFAWLDRNGDGVIEADEMPRRGGWRHGK